MLFTYYIYYIVTTYYVVNGITILDYLHNGDTDNRGHGGYIATLCPLTNGVYCVCVRHAIELHGAIYTLLVWVMGLVTLTLSRSTLAWSSVGFGYGLVCAPFASSTKKNMCFLVC